MSLIYRYVKWFNEIHREDVALVGGKGANLGELTCNGVEVPPGFCVTSQAYRDFIDGSDLSGTIKNKIQSIDVEDSALLAKTCEDVRRLIMDSPVPVDLEAEIIRAYNDLASNIGLEDPRVAVRSSATAEDLPDASFAGQQDT